MSIAWFRTDEPDFRQRFGRFLNRRRVLAESGIAQSAAAIVAEVRANGADAVAQYTRRFDRLSVSPQTLQADGLSLPHLANACPDTVKHALDFAADRIRAYHAHQRPADHSYTDAHGIELGWRWTPIDAVGLYVPGGRASYPSSVLMNALPARVAGVSRLVMVAPAPDGHLNPAVAYAAVLCGIEEFYPIGGAQAIAALALGAGPLKPVDKIVGPGNAYVAAAKRIVFGEVGIDTIAGPSEVTIVADRSASPDWLAADLLSQSEHDPMAQSILITEDEAFARDVVASAERQLEKLATRETAQQSWRDFAGVVICPLSEAAEVVNQIAPEHVQLAIENPDPVSDAIRHAGAIFLGRWAPEALGDFVTGSNHVLPTSGAARFASGLSVLDFMKRTSLQRIPEAGFKALAEAAEALAAAERLPAHGLSISLRRGGA